MMRREVFMGAVGVVLCTGAGSSRLQADGAETPILALYRRYVALTDQAAAHICTTDDEDAELDRLFYDERNRIEDAMIAMPSTCAADFAAKVTVYTCEGSVFTDPECSEVWLEARRLIAART